MDVELVEVEDVLNEVEEDVDEVLVVSTGRNDSIMPALFPEKPVIEPVTEPAFPEGDSATPELL